MKLDRISIILFALIVALALSACGGTADTEAIDNGDASTETTSSPATETTAPDVTTTAPYTTEAPAETVIDPLKDERFDIGNEAIVYEFTPDDEARINEKVDRLEAMLVDCTDYAAFEALYDDVVEAELDYVLTQRAVGNIYYSMTPNNASVSDAYQHIDNYYTTIAQRLITMYRTIYESPFSDGFYADWTEEEITAALAMADQYTEEMVELDREKNELVVEYYALTDDAFATGMRDIYLRLVEVNNRMAELAGYDNYMDYAYYEIYGREYTPEDSSIAADSVIKYIIPAMEGLLDSFNADYTAADQQTQRVVASAIYYDFRQNGAKMLVDEYASILGGDFLETYNAFWNGGSYFFAYDESVSLPQAYTTYLYDYESPAVYFGPGYSAMSTFVHEFGHYYAFATLGNISDEISVDLAEVHSQGNEWLFYSKLDELLGEQAAELLVKYYMFESLQTVLLSTMMNEFEIAVYSADSLTADSFDAIFDEVCESFGGREYIAALLNYDPANYWPLVVVAYDAYYISYAVSQIPALEIYAIAESDFDAALDVYSKLTHLTEEDDIEFTAVMEAAGLKGPFDEMAYSAIGEAVKSLK